MIHALAEAGKNIKNAVGETESDEAKNTQEILL